MQFNLSKSYSQKKELDITNEDILRLYLQGIPASDIAQRANCGKTAIYKRLRKFGVRIRDSSECHRKYKLNVSYFTSIDTQEKAYWLGFLYADGYNDQKNGKIRINLAAKDKDFLSSFLKAVNSNHPIYESITTSGGDRKLQYPQVSISIPSKIMSNDLARLGMIQAKSLVLTFPNLSEKFISSFMLGYFDGDGCIYQSLLNSNKIEFSICSTIPFLEAYKKYLIELTGIKITNNIYQREGNRASQLKLGGRKQIRIIYNFLYSKSPTWLERKREKFESIIAS